MARYKIDGQPRNVVDIKYITMAAARQVNAVYLVASSAVHLIWQLASALGWVRTSDSKFIRVDGKYIRLTDQQ